MRIQGEKRLKKTCFATSFVRFLELTSFIIHLVAPWLAVVTTA